MRAGANDAALENLIRGRWLGRTDRYSELRDELRRTEPQPKKIEMYYIGGLPETSSHLAPGQPPTTGAVHEQIPTQPATAPPATPASPPAPDAAPAPRRRPPRHDPPFQP